MLRVSGDFREVFASYPHRWVFPATIEIFNQAGVSLWGNNSAMEWVINNKVKEGFYSHSANMSILGTVRQSGIANHGRVYLDIKDPKQLPDKKLWFEFQIGDNPEMSDMHTVILNSLYLIQGAPLTLNGLFFHSKFDLKDIDRPIVSIVDTRKKKEKEKERVGYSKKKGTKLILRRGNAC